MVVSTETAVPVPSKVGPAEMDRLIDEVLSARYQQIDRSSLRISTNLKRVLTLLSHRESEAVYGKFKCPAAASRVLSMLWIFGEMATRDICKLTGVSRQSVAGVLNTLDKRGLVGRDRATGKDRRQHTVRITEAGAHVIEPILLAQNEVHSTFFAVLSDEETEQLGAILLKLVRGQVPEPNLSDQADQS